MLQHLDSSAVPSHVCQCIAPSTTTTPATPALLPAGPLAHLLVHPGTTYTPARTEMALPRATLAQMKKRKIKTA